MRCSKCGQDIPDKAFSMHKAMCKPKEKVNELAKFREVRVEPVDDPPAEVTMDPFLKGIMERPASALEKAFDALENTETAPRPFVANGHHGNLDVFYPAPDTEFVISHDNAIILEVTERISKKHPTNLLITGNPGGGKTSIACQFAARFNRPCVIVDFGILQEPQQLFQTTYLISRDGVSQTDTRETGFVKGMETPGCLVILEELNRAENERVLNPLMPFLDGRKTCWVDDLRRSRRSGVYRHTERGRNVLRSHFRRYGATR